MTDALPYPQIERVSGLVVLGPVRRGTCEAEYVQDAKGRNWVRKTEDNSTPSDLLAEALGWLVGRAIGAPVPQVAVCLDPGHRACLSLQVPCVTHWHHTLSDQLVNYDELGAMLTLDLILVNSDRHQENIILSADPDEAHLRAWAIDQANAEAKYPPYYAIQPELPQIRDNFARGLPLDAMFEGAMEAARRAALIPEATLRGFSEEVCEIAGSSDPKEMEALASTLQRRSARASEWTPKYLAAAGKHK